MKKMLTTLALTALSSASPWLSAEKPSSDMESMAVRALAEHLSAPLSAITLVKKEDKTWNDASLGCPKVGLMYPQVITPGAKFTFEKQGKAYFVHASDKRAIVCDNSSDLAVQKSTKKPLKLNELRLAKLTEDAKKDLAEKIGISKEEIKVHRIKSMAWPDSSLGCSDSTTMVKAGKVMGYRMVLTANGRDFTYHTDRDSRAIPCPAIEIQ